MDISFRLAPLEASLEDVALANSEGSFSGLRKYAPSADAIARASTAATMAPDRLRALAFHPDERVPIALLGNDRFWEDSGTGFEKSKVIAALHARAAEAMASEGLAWHPFLTAILATQSWRLSPDEVSFLAARDDVPDVSMSQFLSKTVEALTERALDPPRFVPRPQSLEKYLEPVRAFVASGPPRERVLPFLKESAWHLRAIVCQYYPALTDRDVTDALHDRPDLFPVTARRLGLNESLSKGARARIVRFLLASFRAEVSTQASLSHRADPIKLLEPLSRIPANLSSVLARPVDVPPAFFRSFARSLKASFSRQDMTHAQNLGADMAQSFGRTLPAEILSGVLAAAPSRSSSRVNLRTWEKLINHPSITPDILVRLLENYKDMSTLRLVASRLKTIPCQRAREILSNTKSAEIAGLLVSTETDPVRHERFFRLALADFSGRDSLAAAIAGHSGYVRLDLVDPEWLLPMLEEKTDGSGHRALSDLQRLMLLGACADISSTYDPSRCPLAAAGRGMLERLGRAIKSSYQSSSAAFVQPGKVLPHHAAFENLYLMSPQATLVYSEEELVELASSSSESVRRCARASLVSRERWMSLGNKEPVLAPRARRAL